MSDSVLRSRFYCGKYYGNEIQCPLLTDCYFDAKIKALEAEENARQKALEEERRKEEKKAASRKAISDDDYQVLLRIVQAEAGVCDEKGKILVANVVLNRVKSQEFPDSVRSVVYEPSQFSPVSDGSINSVKVTEETKECVNRALEGEDYSDGALYFMNRRGSRSRAVSWFDSHLTYLFRHQNHEFLNKNIVEYSALGVYYKLDGSGKRTLPGSKKLYT